MGTGLVTRSLAWVRGACWRQRRGRGPAAPPPALAALLAASSLVWVLLVAFYLVLVAFLGMGASYVSSLLEQGDGAEERSDPRPHEASCLA